MFIYKQIVLCNKVPTEAEHWSKISSEIQALE
jgi:hypothetical protein